MKNLVSAFVCLSFLVAGAFADEPQKPKVAVVNLNVLLNNGNLQQRLSLLSLDSDTQTALQKLNAEIKTVKTQVVDATDQAQLNDLQNKLQFVQRKCNLILQKSRGEPRRPDQQLREFLIAAYKDQYALILLSEQSFPDPFLWKGGVEITDITEDALAAIQERLDRISTGSFGGYPGPAPPRPRF